jgi:hypothetical protein
MATKVQNIKPTQVSEHVAVKPNHDIHFYESRPTSSIYQKSLLDIHASNQFERIGACDYGLPSMSYL